MVLNCFVAYYMPEKSSSLLAPGMKLKRRKAIFRRGWHGVLQIS